MAGIWNVNSAYANLNSRKVFSKLSFEVGQVFLARILSSDEDNSELLLKLLDGWQFSAKIENPLESIPNGLLRFVVEGFENGQLQIKLVGENNKEETSSSDSIEEILKEQNLQVGKEEYNLLKKMVKHDMPLTKENITKMKTLLDLKNKLNVNEEEENQFINKYIDSKSLDRNSEEGKKITTALKGFFKELKNTSIDEILTLHENKIELTEDNLKSFQKIFKEEGTIYKDIKALQESLLKEDTIEENKLSSILSRNNEKDFDILKEIKGYLSTKEEGSYKEAVKEILSQKEIITQNATPAKIKTLEEYIQFLKEKVKVVEEQGIEPLQANKNSKGDSVEGQQKELGKGEVIKDIQVQKDTSALEPKKGMSIKMSQQERTAKESKGIEENNAIEESKGIGENNGLEESGSTIKKEALAPKGIVEKTIVKQQQENTASLVKEQISVKTEEMKDIVKGILDRKSDVKPEVYNRILEALSDKLNDFKVFNSVSNQYYYLDVPMSIWQKEYQCRLIIKDDRKKEKAIDSKNVKLVANVKTMNMGMVDAYIKIKDTMMEVAMKCEGKWVKPLNLGKEKILHTLTELGYNVYIRVEEKQSEVDLVRCREFFEDTDISTINVKV